jgi:hypothetical protein
MVGQRQQQAMDLPVDENQARKLMVDDDGNDDNSYNRNLVDDGNGATTQQAATNDVMEASTGTNRSSNFNDSSRNGGKTKKNQKRKRLPPEPSSSESTEPLRQQQQQQQHVFHLLNDYYHRLVYQCHKDLSKHIKRTKNFLLQKQIRTIKEMTLSAAVKQEKEGTPRTPHVTTIQKQEMKLLQMKECFNHPNHKTFITEKVLQECDRRLGIVQLDPNLLLSFMLQPPSPLQNTSTTKSGGSCNTKLKFENEDSYDDDHDNDDDDNADAGGSNIVKESPNQHEKESASNHVAEIDNYRKDVNNPVTQTIPAVTAPPTTSDVPTLSTEFSHTMIQRILQHKTICTALEHWHNEVTQYRVWSMQQQERFYSDHNNHQYSYPAATTKQSRATKKTKKHSNATDPLSSAANDGSIFVSLGGNDKNSDDEGNVDDPYSYYGPSPGDEGFVPKKKNRQGQRGRRAKMAAMEAKKLGRTIPKEESLNWRRGGKSNGGENMTNDQHHNHHPPNGIRNTNHPMNGTEDGTKSAKMNTKTPTTGTTTTTRTTTTTTGTDTARLHPSWQAKKESKATIVAFQGTKITFD